MAKEGRQRRSRWDEEYAREVLAEWRLSGLSRCGLEHASSDRAVGGVSSFKLGWNCSDDKLVDEGLATLNTTVDGRQESRRELLVGEGDRRPHR